MSCSGTPQIRPTEPTVRHGHAVCTHVDQSNTAFNDFICGPVLSWDGEVSAVSKDAIEDALNAKSDTVIDEWDEEFDRGKVMFSVLLDLLKSDCCRSSTELIFF